MLKIKLLAATILLLSFPGLVLASQYNAFTKDIMQPYGFYKKSLALTSKVDKKDKAIVMVGKFIAGWDALADKYANDVPDRLRSTVDFSGKINRPTTVGEEALAMLKAGQVKKAHSHLEEVRYALWRMRTDAGIVSLNDKVNDFHEAMEIVMDGMKADNSSEHLKHLGDRYGAWLAIKWAEIAQVNDSIQDKAAFDEAIKKGESAIVKLSQVLKEGNAAAAKKAMGKVKKGYKSIFFLPESS